MRGMRRERLLARCHSLWSVLRRHPSGGVVDGQEADPVTPDQIFSALGLLAGLGCAWLIWRGQHARCLSCGRRIDLESERKGYTVCARHTKVSR
jgi:hypothetical protein